MVEKFIYNKLPRGRKIVVDLLTMIAPGAVACHLVRDIDMSRANQIKADLAEKGSKITVTAILMKAIALAQKAHPASRSEILPFGRVVTYEDIVAGFTVERNEDGQDTVFFGEIERPDVKSLADIARELAECARRNISDLPPFAQQKMYSGFPYLLRRIILFLGNTVPFLRLKCQKATFGLTSLGKYNISCVFSPCVCTSTFGVGTIESRPVVEQGRIVVRPAMTLSLSYNANAIDTRAAASFLDDVCAVMEGRIPGLIAD